MKSELEKIFFRLSIVVVSFCSLIIISCSQGKNPIERLTANPDTITAGQTTTISWKVNGASKVILSSVSSVIDTSVVVAPAHTTTYILKAITSSGRSFIQKLKVTVLADTVMALASIDPSKPGNAVPPGFLGFSHEWGQAQLLMGNPLIGVNDIYRQLLSNLMAYGGGPLSIRIGGKTTDKTLEPAYGVVRSFAQLYQDFEKQGQGLNFILGVNLGAYNIYRATNQVRAYVGGMPKGSIQAIEIGNEPDAYSTIGYRRTNYRFDNYLAEFHTFTQTILKQVPDCPLFMGPSDAGFAGVPSVASAQVTDFGNQKDLKKMLAQESSVIGIVSQHAFTGKSSYGGGSPESGFLLRPNSSTENPKLSIPYVAIARAAKKSYRITEMNSLMYSGEPGISDAFEAALWMTDILFEYARNGVAGINLHTNNWNDINGWDINGAFLFNVPQNQYSTAKTVRPPIGIRFSENYELKRILPVYYGMLLFSQATAHHARLLPVTLKTSVNIKTWATLDPKTGKVNVVIINKDKSALGDVTLKVPGYSSGTVIRMVAPSYKAQQGITIDGQTFDGSKDGKPVGKKCSETVYGRNGVFQISIGPASAFLLTLSKE